MQKRKEVEQFNEELEKVLKDFPITRKEAKIFAHQLKCETRIRILALNVRYTFSKHSDFEQVPKNIEKMLEFLLLNSTNIDWNSLSMKIETIWRE